MDDDDDKGRNEYYHFWEDHQHHRPFAMGAAFGIPKTTKERANFLNNYTKFIGTSMEGKPHSIHGSPQRDSTFIDFMSLYRNSTFCLIVRIPSFSLCALLVIHLPYGSMGNCLLTLFQVNSLDVICKKLNK